MEGGQSTELSSPDIHIGTSGYSYPHWQGVFYPDQLPAKSYFEFYSQHFQTVEINYSFYRIPTLKQIESWYHKSPTVFLFSLKAPKLITHQHRLGQAGGVARAFIRLTKSLQEKLGVILFQLPPSLAVDLELLREFISDLPAGLKYAFEFRHPSWLIEPLFVLLQDYKIGFCIIDSPLFDCPHRLTADFAYYRFHGAKSWVDYLYSDEELRRFAIEMRQHLENHREVFAYFNNDVAGYAVRNAQRLQEFVTETAP